MCYHLTTLHYEHELLSSVDATYVIHMRNNGRYDDIMRQLNQYHITKTVHIIVNDGYKQCFKPNVHSSPQDIVDTYLYIMNHSRQYDTILVLEDDFIMDPNIYEHTSSINTFVQTHTHFIYRLGCIPTIVIPYSLTTYRGFSVGSHASLYSKSVRSITEKIDDWDIYCNQQLPYIYYKPLVYQLFPSTENSKQWGSHNVIYRYLSIVLFEWLQLLQLNKKIEPGYSVMYMLSKIVVPLIIASIYFHNRYK
jgi:hypothetical protein